MSTMLGISKRRSSEVSLKQLIDDIDVNDEEWDCHVTMLIETRECQNHYTLLLNEVCENGSRKAVHLISREKMMIKLQQPVKGEYSYAVKQSPSVQKIRESIQTSLQSQSSDTAKDTGLTEATLIKWMIYEVRLEWLARSAAEHEEPQPKTKLRRRGEEWRDRVYVDDAPENGPNLYILLTGFRDFTLPLQLVENRVPLNCILRLDNFHFDDEQRYSSCSGTNEEEIEDSTKSDYEESEENNKPIDFWAEFDKSQCPDIAIRSFCPPCNLQDLYDRISYVLYDIYELVQAHAAYLCAMKVIHVYESRNEKQIASDYEIHLSTTPMERTTVDIIVEAMLRQVEQTFQLGDNFFHGDIEQTHEQEEEEEESSRQTSLSGVNSVVAFARLTEKLRLLNLKYELISDQAELILLGGDLLNVCRANDQACDLKDLPSIHHAWQHCDLTEVDACKIHLPGIYQCSKQEGINGYKTKHLLNLLGLRKIFNSNLFDEESSKLSDSDSVRENYYLINVDDKTKKGCRNGKKVLPRRCQSGFQNNNNLSFETKQVYKVQTCNENASEEKLATMRSNENESTVSSLSFDYNQVKFKKDFYSLNESIFKQEQARKLGSTSSSDSNCHCVEPRVTISTKLGETERRLSSLEATSLLRSFEKCTSLFGLIDVRESLGLETSSLSSSSMPSSTSLSYASGYPQLEFVELLASPWVLLDCFHSYSFANVQYFAPTDSTLLLFYDSRPGRMVERRVTCALRTPVCLRDFCEYVVDEESDWLQRHTVSTISENQVVKMDDKSEGISFKDEDFFLPGSLKVSQLLKLKNEQVSNEIEKKSAEKNETAAAKDLKSSSTSSLIKNNGLKVEPTFDFIGYDLGKSRVQVTNLRNSYEASDGTRLRLTRDTWLHDNAKDTTTTSVEIEVPDCCSLRYHEKSHDGSLFHLTMENGIIAAFAKNPHFTDYLNPKNKLEYDIQISWPSGLIVKPVEYPEADYPFYILQYYSSKDFRCETIKNESHRKYLHNGDVVKFFNDGSIVVLRPNGIVIILDSTEEIGDGKSISSWEKTCNHANDAVGLSRETSILLQEYSSEWQETGYLRYVVLELDGRRYEIVDGQIVRELDRLRANLMEEYCAEEKFARRADGTDALFTSKAELIVSFPDGTRILSSCVIEDTEDVEDEDDDGFILVSMYSRAEHPKYASVAGHRLSMHQLEFQLDEFQVDCGNEIRVDAGSTNVSISRQCECSPTSQVSFDLTTREKHLVRLCDKASRLLLTVWREDGRFELTPEICEHQTKTAEGKQRRNCRMFAVSRDGLTCEYLHRSTWQSQFLQEMFDDYEACLIRNDEDGVERFLGLLPINKWTMEYKIRKAKPSVVDEEDEELAFKATTTRQRFLRARLVEGIGNANENSLISMQRALLRYWREIATGRGKAFETKASAITCECRGEIETWMRDVALGRVGTIDPESYEAGCQELKKLRAEQDEERTRQMIDRSYARDSMPETDVLGWDNE